MRQGSGKPGLFGAPRARYADLDPICVSPYRPAACELPLHEAGHTKAPDHMREPKEKILAFHGASTHVCATCGMSDSRGLDQYRQPPSVLLPTFIGISYQVERTVRFVRNKKWEVYMGRLLAVLLAVFALSLAACGTPSQDPDIQKHSGVGGNR